MPYLRKYKNIYIPLIIGVLIGFSSNLVLSADNKFTTKEHRSGGYKLINPLYECDIDESFSGHNFGKLENRISDLINESIEKDGVDKISVYFRDLNNGPWFGVNEKEKFAPASLLKVPIAIALFKKAEKDPLFLKKESTYDNKIDTGQITQNFKPTKQIEAGKTYSVESLIESMISRSDNKAMDLLIRNKYVETQDVEKVLKDLEITSISNKTGISDVITVREYSSLFRVLYNASYLGRENSEKLLNLLSNADFVNGLRKPIPSDVVIANKFGERKYTNNQKTTYQLHDCGIVYFDKHPYFLCIMTEGDNFESLLKTIQAISKETYEEFVNKYN
ncbi:MAG: hypothetical protein ACD_37C00144G0002 [uncultured bacterium]|nr:MAG: hypothetical protein ACD_37C00144G0002 [uncultured bacterium]